MGATHGPPVIRRRLAPSPSGPQGTAILPLGRARLIKEDTP
jgi:hypothetical protein